MGLDYRDRFRPGGGRSRLTIRRLLLIVDLVLDRSGSRFWAAVMDVDAFTTTERLLMDLFYVQTEQQHPLRTRREDAARARERDERKKQIKAAERRRRRMAAELRHE